MSWATIIAPDESGRAPMNRLITVAHLTLHEALRKRILLATTLCGIAFLALYAVGFHFIAAHLPHGTGGMAAAQRQLALSSFTLAGLYAANFLALMSAVLLPVDTLSGEIASGVAQTLASKPMRRSEIVLGKWLAYVCVATAYVLALAGGVVAIAHATAGYTPPGTHVGLPLMAFEVVLLVTLSIWGGARFSTVTNGIVAFGLYGLAFLGGWVEQIGALTHNVAAQNVGTIASLIMPTECLWQLAAHHMQPPFLAQLHLTPFSPAAVPSAAMVAWAGAWGLTALLGALRTFARRPL
jgi:ABC-type transport system involved in multi-copper enzyme maturation permease subunit